MAATQMALSAAKDHGLTAEACFRRVPEATARASTPNREAPMVTPLPANVDAAAGHHEPVALFGSPNVGWWLQLKRNRTYPRVAGLRRRQGGR